MIRPQSRRGLALTVAAVLVTALAAPAAASAHGPVAPLASSYLARVTSAPAGVNAVVVDGDQRLWVRVAPGHRLVVLDPRGAPYLRLGSGGVSVNERSELWYLNQTPVAAVPPPGLTRTTPPRWSRVAGGLAYEWHDGRLHALATVARAPGATEVGHWSIPVALDGRALTVGGVLDHADAPSPVWFWPAVVAVLCLLAARRLRRADLDRRLARAVAAATLAAIVLAGAARYLHGRPAVDPFGVVEFGVTTLLAVWALAAVARGRIGFLGYFVIAFVALWEAVTLLPALTHGYVLAGVPPFPTRVATVVCLGGGACLLLLAFRLAEERPPRARAATGDRGTAPADIGRAATPAVPPTRTPR
jgi:hypothetical protein